MICKMPPTSTVPRPRSTIDKKTVNATTENKKELSPQQGPENTEEFGLPPQQYSLAGLLFTRLLYVTAIYLCYVKADAIQGYIDTSWEYLRDQWWFQTVYFETLFVVVFSFPSTLTFQIIDKIPYFDKFRIESKGGHMISESIPALVYHSIEYILPLAILDTFHVKHYYGVTDDVIMMKQRDWIQTTRALPEFAPRFHDIGLHIFVAMVIYDFLFSIIHYNLHRNQTLYRILHKKHHTHDVINAKVTDHEHWVERIIFILCANAGLKVQGAHPFTRMIFVCIYVSFLLYNHGGYDFPWAPDRVVPFGIMAGARQHYEHHAKGKRYYQFMLTYLDTGLDWWTERKKLDKKTTK